MIVNLIRACRVALLHANFVTNGLKSGDFKFVINNYIIFYMRHDKPNLVVRVAHLVTGVLLMPTLTNA